MASVKSAASGTSDEKVALQTRLLQTPGTPWYTVTNGTLLELQALFPKGCKHSLQARGHRKRLLSEVEEGLEERASAAAVFTPTVPLQADFQTQDDEAADESVQHTVSGERVVETVDIYDRGTVGENIFHLCVLTRSQDSEGRLMIRWLVEVFGSELINCPYQRESRVGASTILSVIHC
ncbi:hypothetical protein CYMTET_7626 [Cymbomonas tetramitiformis]|uniref:Uncharacterized protein n=1 Tax=Cymbomonas tetramitiformis TaxID=36881 RepID=A0AAE0GV57_9CHLO|nr:hypothetical protein CYMTET_7626 [Cymbomonas tetramitiformis]